MTRLRNTSIVRVPIWGLSLGDAAYYGRRWCLHLGPWLIFFWQMTDAELGCDE